VAGRLSRSRADRLRRVAAGCRARVLECAPAGAADPPRGRPAADRGGRGMIVLGLDTATLSTAVGLRLADGRTFQARDDPGREGRPGHATRLLAIAGELLAGAGVGWSELDRIAVGLGPGRFTGLRV